MAMEEPPRGWHQRPLQAGPGLQGMPGLPVFPFLVNPVKDWWGAGVIRQVTSLFSSEV